jgi:hypothetical protein
MSQKAWRFGRAGIFWMALVLGCSKAPQQAPDSAPAGEEATVRAQFVALQAALEDGDAGKLWMVLDSKSQADAERAAKAIRAAYAKAGPDEKAELEKSLGLSGSELAQLTGKGFLKTKRFRRKYRDMPGSTIEKVVIQGESATVSYLESDGDKEKAVLVRQDGQWKVWLTMPSVGKS